VDRAALRQTLLNLLDNAVKYGPAGQTVRLAVQRTGTRVRLTVDDGGPGIAAEDRERVWLPFYRLERDARSAIAGSGIGLAVVRDLISLHGGRVCVEDAPGGGARFVVELTCEPAADGADGVPAPARSPIAARDVARDAIRSPQPAL
jgi:signal transduction histidine kinase